MNWSVPSWETMRRELIPLLFLVVGVLGARSTLADHYHVPTGSMEHTLQVGDRVLVDKRAYGFRVPFTHYKISSGHSVRRGEIVIFDSPTNGKRLIKRVVAIGGDTVEINNGHLFINGVSQLADGYPNTEVIGEHRAILNLADGGGPNFAATLTAGSILAVGDHRGNSADGRYFGVVDENEIYGRAIAVYYRRGTGFSWLQL